VTLADQIIDNGPYLGGDQMPAWLRELSTAAGINALRAELIELRRLRTATEARDIGPCSARMPSLLLGQPNLMCELRHGHTGDHTDGPTRWGERDDDEHTEQPHRYLSTACLHNIHDDCDIDTRRYDGTRKTAATCKYCPAPCVCPHHKKDGQHTEGHQ
jgi:hypothetical protein